MLDAEEDARYAQFKVEPARKLYLAAHLLVRFALSRYRVVPPGAWRFARNRFGRPHITAPAAGVGLHFNLSHTTGLVALVVADTPDIGIDVEDRNRALDPDRLAPAVFAPAELAALARLSEAGARRARFYALWTLKESYIKARGMGLSLPLDGFAFDLGGPEPAIAFTPGCPDDPARWRFWRREPTGDHCLAVTMPAGTDTLRMIHLDLGAEVPLP